MFWAGSGDANRNTRTMMVPHLPTFFRFFMQQPSVVEWFCPHQVAHLLLPESNLAWSLFFQHMKLAYPQLSTIKGAHFISDAMASIKGRPPSASGA